MTKKLKKHLIKTIVGFVIFAVAFVLNEIEATSDGIVTFFSIGSFDVTLLFFIFLLAYVVIGGDVVIKAGKNIINGQMLDENFLMVLATVGAFFVGDYAEAVAVMVFYQVGEFFQEYAVNRARNSIKDLMKICPDEAVVLRDGEEETVDPDEVMVGETIIIRPGEKVPLDGIVTKGESSLDTKALTGESVPRYVLTGEEVISGCINLDGVIEVQVTKEFGEATVTKILELVENAQSKKGQSEKFITKFAHWYTPLVVACALILAIAPPVINGVILKSAPLGYALFQPYIYRALTFLVISCPCALVISIPLSFFGGIGGASKKGILIKGSNYLESLVKAEYVVMDKTGTLTKGSFEVTKVKSLATQYSDEMVLALLAKLEEYSNHPIASSIRRKYKASGADNEYRLENVKELAGYGVSGELAGELLYAGNAKLLSSKKIEIPDAESYGTIVYLSSDDKCLGYCLLEDEIKSDSKQAVHDLLASGVKDVVMLTGDRKETADKVAAELGITNVKSELLPGDKVDRVEELINSKSEKGMLVFVGDGINDAPVLARADIGIAMGGLGADAAIEAADIVIMDDKPSKIALAMKISKKTIRIVKENIVFAIGVKLITLLMAALGLAGMWWAIFADVGVAVIAILNAMRALRIKE